MKARPYNFLYFINGLVTTVVGAGGSVSAAKKLAKSRGYLGVAAKARDNSGLEAIALDVLSHCKRAIKEAGSVWTNSTDRDAILAAQSAHNHFVHQALRSLAADGTDVVFVGYAPAGHRLARRTSTENPLAPMFAFTHHKYGRMEVTSRDLGEPAAEGTGSSGGIHFTISYAGHDTHHASPEKRAEYYAHERLGGPGLMEARFGGDASQADPGTVQFDAAAGFDQIDSAVNCMVTQRGEWPGKSVLSVQRYDQVNEATFGFASVGMFADDHSGDSGQEGFTPRGMPLEGGGNC